MATLVQLLVFACLLLAVSCSVCYDDLGCFDTSMACHWRNPSSPADIGTTFKLYTRQNRYSGDVLDRTDDATITSSNFESSLDTKLIVHGWTDSMTGDSWIDMRDALLDNYDINVVMVDWSDGAKMFYTKSRANTRVVGREIAKLIEALNAATGATFGSMHIIGHSLGRSHRWLRRRGMHGHHWPSIRPGLDPAGPEFAGDLDKSCRLDNTDANFVDVMHTDGEILILGGLGLMDELGHQDFYPNNGQEMPGCEGISPTCDHLKAVEYFIESISSTCSFTATKKGSTWDDLDDGLWTSCTSSTCPQMGYKADLSKGQGAFYLETNADSPYCQ
ncbi:pancreatic lipase-related protein 2 [Strongylocentrotus purpuratus]|uniref:Lipase domain-containing protein n=1 Tax=Strongylocentrotus purpuratus TaxID=7668 RepID=A0A7M7P073_STRPU|nr:pancreatic lipase-related protein 2 [Strongylocentrotus purpuratus]